MKEEQISWDRFKLKISDHVKNGLGPRLCRGQARASDWKLVTSFHRNPNGVDFPSYFAMLRNLADTIGTIEKRPIDINDPENRGAFVAYLQHHGYPTPLLDWSLSPYIAAFFAFDDEKCLSSEFVAIYVFDFLKWMAHWDPILDYTSKTRHVSIISPKSNGNMRQVVQQGAYYTFTNVPDIESHIQEYEKKKETEYLEKYLLASSERTYALNDLEVMGINSFSLFGTTDALCKSYRDAIFVRTQDGKGAIQRIQEIMLDHIKQEGDIETQPI